MSYAVKEIVYTLQGEGAQTGRAAVFCRFAGCNLWSGREEDRADAICRFCDTDFVGTDGPGGGRFESAEALARAIHDKWPKESPSGVRPFVVCTGGEPLLQLDESLISELSTRGFEIAVETNGTLPAPDGLDWICVSPKPGTDLVIVGGDELKLAYPQEGINPEEYQHLNFRHFFLQPIAGPDREENTRRAVEFCLKHPTWRLSLQVHKMLGLP